MAIVKVEADSSFQVVFGLLDLKVVVIFSCPHVEDRLILLESDGETDLGAKHHLRAVHEVEHDIFKFGHQSLLVDQVEVNLLVGGDLDAHVALDEIKLASNLLKFGILFPFTRLFINFIEVDRA